MKRSGGGGNKMRLDDVKDAEEMKEEDDGRKEE